ncbi:hypothetical protein [Gloeocapsa sp. PCC 73106]|uniref:hypothetical protein n=1 Tax=Gloeocapsa sp. PCC 73106 TaxID=102232 RepID=UPI0002ABD925|nr:hypothetical protein [Gloeocapsa sp. PCC 73106]ELR96251.1 hypothetical protein GLO73106DRAFT_00000390 [Gloeocapsa sp. PCC 73106]
MIDSVDLTKLPDMYYIPESPYLLVVFGFLASITSGLAFEASLKQKVQELCKSPREEQVAPREQLEILIPFLGICGGITMFLAGGLGLFEVKLLIASVISLILTALIGLLIWYQLGKLLVELQEGGSKAIDLDAYE